MWPDEPYDDYDVAEQLDDDERRSMLMWEEIRRREDEARYDARAHNDYRITDEGDN